MAIENNGQLSRHVRRRASRNFLKYCAAIPATLVLMASCSSNNAKHEDTEVASVAKEALVTASSVTVTLPSGVSWPGVSVAAINSVDLRDRVKISGLTTVSGTNSQVTVGNDAKVATLESDGKVTIGDRSVVNGDIKANGTIKRSTSSTVTGSVVANAGLTTQQITWNYGADSTSLGSITLNSGQSQTLAQGTYGDLTLNSQAAVTLSTGVYVFHNMNINAQAQLLIDSTRGPVQIYITGSLTFQGSVVGATTGMPQVLFVVTGTSQVMIQPSFVGVLIAPNADVHLQAAQPNGYRGQFFGKTVTLEPDTVITPYPFDWGTIVPSLSKPIDPSTPFHLMPKSPADKPLAVDKTGAGNNSSSTDFPSPVTFKLPQTFPVEGGVIANGTVTVTFRNGTGPSVTCTYKGGSSSATPATKDELNAGRYLNFQSCSDGLPVTTIRTATHVDTTVTPAPNLPVTVNTPINAFGACSDKMEILTAQQTTQMLNSFSWNSAKNATWPGSTTKGHVAEKNSDQTPTLYYAWIFVQNKNDAIRLRQLYVHVLGKPLFQAELEQYGAACGTFINPGDGDGQFVPVVLPGALYNKMIDVLSAGGLTSNAPMFQAVILRKPSSTLSPTTFPSGAAVAANGSISYSALANSGFKYLGYDSDPWSDKSNLNMYSKNPVAALVDAVKWVGQAAKDIGHEIEKGIAYVNKWWAGSVNVDLSLNAITGDASFGTNNPIMYRGWGNYANIPMAAPGLRVSVLQKFEGTFIPTTQDGYTDMTGYAHIDAVKGQSPRGSGLCINLSNDAMFMTDFLWSSDICDLRGFNANVSSTVGNFQLNNFDHDVNIPVKIWNTRLAGFYQADDVYRWDQSVLGWTPHQATIMSGSWADTFSTHNNGMARMWTPCLTYSKITAELETATQTVGLIADILVPGASVVTFAMSVFEEIIGRTDIMMATTSKIDQNREVMSHEFGHYTFCGLMHDQNSVAVDHIVWSVIGGKEDRTKGYTYANEAFADFIAGQVTGGVDYGWLNWNSAVVGGGYGGQFCVPTSTAGDRCIDHNFKGVDPASDNKTGVQNIARISSMMFDAFDGNINAKGQNVPDNGDSWYQDTTAGALLYSTSTYGSRDSNLETVALPGKGLVDYAHSIANGLGDFGTGAQIDDPKIYGALNYAMVNNGVSSWCDRCRVLGLHSPSRGADDDIGAIFSACVSDSVVKNALGGTLPDANGRINAATCQACPAGQYSNADGVCTVCQGVLTGNTCSTCPIDLVLDGNTMATDAPVSYDPSVPTANDSCPSVYWVQVNNPAALFTRGVPALTVTSGPINMLSWGVQQADCQQSFELDLGHLESAGPVIDTTLTGTGVWSASGGQLVVNTCTGMPSKVWASAADVAGQTSLVFAVPNSSTKRLWVDSTIPAAPPIIY